MKNTILSLLTAFISYSALIWGIPFAFDVEVGVYWSNFSDLFGIPCLIWLIFISKDSLYGFLKDTHQNNLDDIERQKENYQ
jgi:hypothetical protein